MISIPNSVSTNNSSLPIVELRDVVKIYKSDAGEFTALRGINTQIFQGEFLGVIGKSGAGKSTFLNMITGVDTLTQGDVLVRPEGKEVSIHHWQPSSLLATLHWMTRFRKPPSWPQKHLRKTSRVTCEQTPSPRSNRQGTIAG